MRLQAAHSPVATYRRLINDYDSDINKTILLTMGQQRGFADLDEPSNYPVFLFYENPSWLNSF